MLLGWFSRKLDERAEKECREEILRIAGEWDKLGQDEKNKQSTEAFFSRRLMQLDQERESRRKEREREGNRDEPNLMRVLYIPFGHIPYFNWE